MSIYFALLIYSLQACVYSSNLLYGILTTKRKDLVAHSFDQYFLMYDSTEFQGTLSRLRGSNFKSRYSGKIHDLVCFEDSVDCLMTGKNIMRINSTHFFDTGKLISVFEKESAKFLYPIFKTRFFISTNLAKDGIIIWDLDFTKKLKKYDLARNEIFGEIESGRIIEDTPLFIFTMKKLENQLKILDYRTINLSVSNLNYLDSRIAGKKYLEYLGKEPKRGILTTCALKTCITLDYITDTQLSSVTDLEENIIGIAVFRYSDVLFVHTVFTLEFFSVSKIGIFENLGFYDNFSIKPTFSSFKIQALGILGRLSDKVGIFTSIPKRNEKSFCHSFCDGCTRNFVYSHCKKCIAPISYESDLCFDENYGELPGGHFNYREEDFEWWDKNLKFPLTKNTTRKINEETNVPEFQKDKKNSEPTLIEDKKIEENSNFTIIISSDKSKREKTKEAFQKLNNIKIGLFIFTILIGLILLLVVFALLRLKIDKHLKKLKVKKARLRKKKRMEIEREMRNIYPNQHAIPVGGIRADRIGEAQPVQWMRNRIKNRRNKNRSALRKKNGSLLDNGAIKKKEENKEQSSDLITDRSNNGLISNRR